MLNFVNPFAGPNTPRDSAGGEAEQSAAKLPVRRFSQSEQIHASHAQNISVELQIKQACLESTLSDTMVEMVHVKDELARVNSKLETAHEHIETHVARENMMENMLASVEELMGKMQYEMEERLDVEELVGYRSYAQKREKEVKSRLDMLQDDNDRKDVLIKDQPAEIARLKGELQVRSNDLELAIEDLKTCTNREWKKHRSVCMEIGGVYIDFNHQEEVGLTMDRSSTYGPDALGMTGSVSRSATCIPLKF